MFNKQEHLSLPHSSLKPHMINTKSALLVEIPSSRETLQVLEQRKKRDPKMRYHSQFTRMKVCKSFGISNCPVLFTLCFVAWKFQSRGILEARPEKDYFWIPNMDHLGTQPFGGNNSYVVSRPLT